MVMGRGYHYNADIYQVITIYCAGQVGPSLEILNCIRSSEVRSRVNRAQTSRRVASRSICHNRAVLSSLAVRMYFPSGEKVVSKISLRSPKSTIPELLAQIQMVL